MSHTDIKYLKLGLILTDLIIPTPNYGNLRHKLYLKSASVVSQLVQEICASSFLNKGSLTFGKFVNHYPTEPLTTPWSHCEINLKYSE